MSLQYTGLHYNSSCQWRLSFFLVKCFHANFTFGLQAQNTIISIFFESFFIWYKHTIRHFTADVAIKRGLEILNKSRGGRKGRTRWVKLWLQFLLWAEGKRILQQYEMKSKGESTHIAPYTAAIFAKPQQRGRITQFAVFVRSKVGQSFFEMSPR